MRLVSKGRLLGAGRLAGRDVVDYVLYYKSQKLGVSNPEWDYVGMGDKIPIGAAMNKGLTFKMGQTHVQAYTRPLLQKNRAPGSPQNLVA